MLRLIAVVGNRGGGRNHEDASAFGVADVKALLGEEF